MAKGRMLNKKISLDEKVNQLSCDTARLLFTWMIAHLDQNGCFYADPNIVKNLVFPRRDDLKIKKIAQILDEFDALGLIQRYKLNEEPYLYYPHFEQNQPGLRKEREAKSDIPLPDKDGLNPTDCRSKDGNTPLEQKYNRSITEVAPVTECQQQILQELRKLPHWKVDDKDIEWVIDFKGEFPIFWISHIKACRDYWDGKKIPRSKGDWKNRLRNWMKNDRPGSGKILTDSSKMAWNK